MAHRLTQLASRTARAVSHWWDSVRPQRLLKKWSKVRRGKVDWFLDESLVDEFLNDQGLRFDDWREQGLLETIKKGRHRAVYRLNLASGVYYLKYYRIHSIRSFGQNNLRGSKAFRELRAADLARKVGVPTFETIAYGYEPRLCFTGDNYLISREIPHGTPLDVWLQQTNLETLPTVLRKSLILELAKLTARLHRHNLRHNDFHPGNVLIEISPERNLQLWLIDLHPLQHIEMTATRRKQHLAKINWTFRKFHNASDRQRFYRAYCRALGQKTEARDVWKGLLRASRDQWRQGLRSEDRKWKRPHSALRVRKQGQVQLRALSQLEPAFLDLALANYDALQETPEVKFDDRHLAITCEQITDENNHPWSCSTARKIWELAYFLHRRSIAVRTPLAIVEHTGKPGLLIYEKRFESPLHTSLARASEAEAQRLYSVVEKMCQSLGELGFDSTNLRVDDFSIMMAENNSSSRSKVILRSPQRLLRRKPMLGPQLPILMEMRSQIVSKEGEVLHAA
ncbi:lipopolysaccharide kinase InaA family protein [Calycomorphotria hydatis]|uniref:3-deoxy-D-manno-octulosonic-acid kinase n=1 Tax=Calycomorphotria hydatis TaxID=2528027 RepID=A0A517T7M0_9PLAN|nr:lipopolysaccharide kinase InaA family protein [Calycomorphotria hydatis]QDT64365.1 3-deoxy-D-manno-octulosonic-acid kinase [Calycomorphotria hydatis]